MKKFIQEKNSIRWNELIAEPFMQIKFTDRCFQMKIWKFIAEF